MWDVPNQLNLYTTQDSVCILGITVKSPPVRSKDLSNFLEEEIHEQSQGKMSQFDFTVVHVMN